MAKKLSTNDIIKKVNKLYNGEYKLISKYTNNKEPITIRHNCGYEYTVKRAKTFLTENGGLCPKCNTIKSHSTKRMTEEDFIEKLKNEVGNEYTYISGFVNTNTKLKLSHNICNHIYEVSPHMFLGSKKRRCPICGNKNRGKYLIRENYLDELLQNNPFGNEFKWIDEYKNNSKLKHKILHKKCNRTYYVKPNDFQQGYYCPYCSAGRSQVEIEIEEFIKSKYNGEIISNYRIDNNEIDIYLPDLNIGFEVNGYYFHSDKFKNKNFHLNKKDFFLDHNINVIYILDIDWYNKNEIWKSRILHLIKCDNSEKVYARKTKVKYNLKYNKKKKFLDNNHLQGNCQDDFNLYLSYNKKIVAIMTFGHNRVSVNNKKNRIELIRYAVNNNYNVIGGFSKLMKYAKQYILENYDYTEIYTFADKDISNGNVYNINGFILDHMSKPSYCYVYKKEKVNRYKFRKSNLKKLFPNYYDESLSEFKILDKVPNLYRIYNCGNYVYKYELK